MSLRTEDPRSAFDAAVLPLRRRLYALAVSILRDSGEAEDALQEALVRAWGAWARFDGRNLDGWLATITVNYCISRRRRLMRHGFFHAEAMPTSTAAAISHGADAAFVDLDNAYRHLTVKQRAALTLNYLYGYTVEECAATMRMRPGTVRSHIARALVTLRREMTDA